ncbi:MAG: cobalamin-binding protein, partial [Planctomycetota bacterium]
MTTRTQPRIASLLPSATEMVCAVGARAGLVGRSHECDYPADVTPVPILTGPRRALPHASGAIDRTIREILTDAIAVYEVDVAALEQARPDVIVTQDLCDVCAVSLDDVRTALRELAQDDVQICSLKPSRLQDVWDDVRRVGEALGRPAEGEAAASALEARCAEIARQASNLTRRSVLSIEWLDPVMVGGTWMPELIAMAGGDPLVTQPGEHAPTLDLEQLAALDPDVVLIKPCGFDLARTAEELDLVATKLPWGTWRAVRNGKVFLADGNAYFNRPGPRLVESLEILAAITHPEVFPGLTRRHATSMRVVTPDRQLVPPPVSGA